MKQKEGEVLGYGEFISNPVIVVSFIISIE
jgi:hypothetical protein